MKSALLASLVALLVGCGARSTLPVADPLQRLDASTSKLSTVSQVSRHAAADADYLATAVGAGNVPASRAAAVAVKRDGALLISTTSHAATLIRPILTSRVTAVVYRYAVLVLRVLSYQWQEAIRLIALCDLVWADPLIRDQREQQRLSRLSLGTRWFAWQAVLSARASTRWKSAHTRFFRYHAVTISPARVSEGYAWT